MAGDRAAFPKAKVLNAERVRFEIAGGNYRLIVAFKFRNGIAFVKFLGTHADYDRIDALAISEMGHSQADLAEILGSLSRASEILNGKRGLNTDAVYRISKAWCIPAELLVGPRPDRRAA
ncbi:type II toxin-antitoxin system HigB family toxin [Labrys neptuniae]